jgi:acetyl esterase/lipase
MLVRGARPLAQRRPERSFRTRVVVGTLQAAAGQVTRLSPQGMRASLDALARFAPTSLGVSRRRATVGGARCEWFVPRGWKDGATFIHLHGGGYTLCSTITHRMMIADLCVAAQARGLGVDYRLAPEHPFPAALDDCESTYHALLQQGVPPGRIVLTGDSAGGTLVLATMFRLREKGLPMPAAGVLMSPWVDITCPGRTFRDHAASDYLPVPRLHGYADLYRGDEPAQSVFISPIHADLEGLPPLLLQAGNAEVMIADIIDFEARARAAGVDITFQTWDGMPHAFQGFTLFLPEAREAMVAAGEFIKDRTRLAVARPTPPALTG